MKRFKPVEDQLLLGDLNAADVVQIRTKNIYVEDIRERLLLVRADQSLLCYKYDQATQSWSYLWERRTFFSVSDNQAKEPWLVSEDGFVVARTATGIHIYKFDKSLSLNHCAMDGRYHDAYGWSKSDHVLLLGHFYLDPSKIGIMSRDETGKVQFEAVIKEEALKGSALPIWKMETDPKIHEIWSDSKTDIRLAQVDSSPQEAFIIRSTYGFSVNKFGKSHHLEEVYDTFGVTFSENDEDKLLFGRIFNKNELFHDMLHFNKTGLTVYKYNSSEENFDPVIHTPQFASEHGWTACHTDSVLLSDIDGDGLDEMLYNGPSGFNVVKISSEGGSIDLLISANDLDVNDRHLKTFVAPQAGLNVKQLISIGQRGLVSFQLDQNLEENIENNILTESEIENTGVQNFIPLLPQSTTFRSTIPLHDQLDYKSFLQPRNPLLGTLEFSVPLIDVPNPFGMPILQSIIYKEYHSSDILGSGWSFPIDCIYIDRRGSIFPVEHNYYIVTGGMQAQLYSKLEDLSSEYTSYTLNGSPDLDIKFYKSQNRWEVQSAFGVSIYGSLNNIDWIQWEAGSDEWPVFLSTSRPAKVKPSVWFLAKKQDKHENYLKYIYTPEYSKLASGTPYVHKLNLLKIVSSNGDRVRFRYGNVYNTKLLTGFHVETSTCVQKINFNYGMVKQKPHLISITQNDFKPDILRFTYEGLAGELTEIVYPNGLVSKFTYSTLTIPSVMAENRFESFSDVQVTYGPSYMLFGGKTESGQVRIQARDVVGSSNTQMSSLLFPLLGKEPVSSFQIITAESFFLVILTHSSHKEACLFRQQSNLGWSAEASYMKLPKESSIEVGKSFFLARKGKNLAVIQLVEDRWDMKPVLNNLDNKDIVKAFPFGYVVYNDSNLLVGFQDNYGTWKTNQVPIEKNLIQSSLQIFDLFDTDHTTIGNLKQMVKDKILQIHHNAIVVRTLSLEEHKIYLNLHFKIFNHQYELISDETVVVLVEDLDQFGLELPPMDGNYFKIGYKLVNGKYQVFIRTHSGKISDEVNHLKAKVEEETAKLSNASEAEKNEYRQQRLDNLNSELQDIYENITAKIPFAIDPSKFDVIVNNNFVVAASYKFHFDGTHWQRGKIPENEINVANFSLNLGTSFLLTKSGKDETFKLYERNSILLWDLNSTHGDSLLLSYPAFIGVQRNDTTEIFTFETRKVHRLPQGEFISRLSNPLAIVTMTEDQKSVTVRSMKSFTNYRQNAIIKQELLHGDLGSRTTSFDYDETKAKPFADGFAFTKSRILPGGDPLQYGWYEETFNLATMGNSSKTVHNSNGTVVEIVEPEKSSSQDEIDNDRILTDRLERFKIVDFEPYRMSQEVVSYYGFEPYEQNRIGMSSNWIFDAGLVTQEDGNHFLRLNSTSVIAAQLQPKLSFMPFILSCWIRSAQAGNISDCVNFRISSRVSGKLLSHVEGKIQHQVGDWYYVEAVSENDHRQDEVTLTVEIRNPSAAWTDVDHLRMSPLHLNVQANILDPYSGRVRAVLKNSGTLQQKLFDPLGNESVRVSGKGNVEQYTLKSKNYARSKNGDFASVVKMRPSLGMITCYLQNPQITLKYNPEAIALRFLYKLAASGQVMVNVGVLDLQIVRNLNFTTISTSDHKPMEIDSEGELTLLILKTRYVIWVQGHLLAEHPLDDPFKNQSSTIVNMTTAGHASIYEILQLYDPTVQVVYLNKIGLVVQEITLKDHNTVNIRQIVYDGIDRPLMKTKWVELTAENGSLLNYNPKVVTNLDSVTTTGKVQGLANDLNSECEGYPYSITVYRNNPLEQKSATGQPGQAFSVEGQYSSKYSTNTNISIVKVLFSAALGYTYEVEDSHGSQTVKVFDRHKNKVAELIKVMNHDHRLTTYEYNDQQKLTCMLPPMYHRRAKTLSKGTHFDPNVLTADESMLKDKWGKHYQYDIEGRMVQKVTPDSGIQKLYYSGEGLLRFVVQSYRNNSAQHTVFYTYRFDGKVVEKGLTNISRDDLQKYIQNDSVLPKSDNFVVYDSGENDLAPLHRNLIQRSVKVSNGITVTETLLFDEKEQLLNQIFVSNNGSLAVNYRYNNDRITKLEYPFFVGGKPLKISYDYGLNGRVNRIRIGNRQIANVDYTPLGSVKQMQFEPQNRFTYKRAFTYNQPGYQSLIQDKFLTERIDYISNSYGGQTFGDGTVSATTFNATWYPYSNMEQIKLKASHFLSNDTSTDQAKLCFDTLKSHGYLDTFGRPLKSFYPAAEFRMPLVCNTGSRANHISEITVKEGFPQLYGHRYDYESHKQLIKAKYFQNEQEFIIQPLTELTFSRDIQGITDSNSRTIWNALRTSGFIITDCSNSRACHAVLGKSLFHTSIAKLINDASLEILFANAVKRRSNVSEKVFMKVCEIWHHNNMTKLCADIWKELLSNGFVETRSDKSINALNPELRQVLKPYSRFISDIVGVLYDQSVYGLGNSAGDVQSYDIDANGNHVHFYTGFKRYHLKYEESTNKITKILCTDLTSESLREIEYPVEHDSEGNVIKAMHKAIQKIVYDPLIKRATEIRLTDGRMLKFRYNVRGERIFKQVVDHRGRILKEKIYIRDVKGKCLADYDLTYLQHGSAPHVQSTAYIYLEETLIGFLRNDQFFSVFTDHEGSVRLVIKNGEVIAAYDYLPYGQLLRKFDKDLEGSIAYLYTGQEWDEETGLYNFHARLYDPEIGRFYQIDPKEQYPSPYVYAGNSPISLVDPDGQFAFLIPIAFAAVGAYLGAAAANNSFDPSKWNLSKAVLGGFLGAIAGGLAPGSIHASFTFLTAQTGSAVIAGGILATTSVGFAYLSGAASNMKWNPADWNWSSPATWNMLFAGALTGVAGFEGFSMVYLKFAKLTLVTDKISYGLVVFGGFSGFAVSTGAMGNDWNFQFWEWDWTNPDTVWKVVQGGNFGFKAPALKYASKLFENQLSTTVIGEFKSVAEHVRRSDSNLVISKVKVLYSDAPNLFRKVAQTMDDLSIKVTVYSTSILVAAKLNPPTADAYNTVKSVLLPIVTFEPFRNATIGLLDNMDSNTSSLNHSDLFASRRKRDVNCCQLQIFDHSISVDQSNTVPSSASKNFLFLNRIFESLQFFYGFIFSKQSLKANHSNYVGHRKTSNTPCIKSSYTLNNCYQFHPPDQPSIVRCYGQDSQFEIFFTKNYEHRLIEDFYSYCTPVEYGGRPSVTCHGKESTLMFTSRPLVVPLDLINGFLMLALVTPSVISNVKQCIKKALIFIFGKSRSSTPTLKHDIDKLLLKRINLKEKVKNASEELTDTVWIQNIWEDLRNDTDEFLENPESEVLYSLIDRFEALEEELNESLELLRALDKNECLGSVPGAFDYNGQSFVPRGSSVVNHKEYIVQYVTSFGNVIGHNKMI